MMKLDFFGKVELLVANRQLHAQTFEFSHNSNVLVLNFYLSLKGALVPVSTCWYTS